MPNLILAPELERVVVHRRGVLTVPVSAGLVGCSCSRRLLMLADQPRECSGWMVGALPVAARALELYALRQGERFVSRMRVRGYEPVGHDAQMRLHGPWISMNFDDILTHPDSDVFRQAEKLDRWGDTHPELAMAAVSMPDTYVKENFDYLLIGAFIKRFERVDLEVPYKEEIAPILLKGLHGKPIDHRQE